MDFKEIIGGDFKSAKKVSALIRSERKAPPRYVRRRKIQETKKLIQLAKLLWEMREKNGEVEWISLNKLRLNV